MITTSYIGIIISLSFDKPYTENFIDELFELFKGDSLEVNSGALDGSLIITIDPHDKAKFYKFIGQKNMKKG